MVGRDLHMQLESPDFGGQTPRSPGLKSQASGHFGFQRSARRELGPPNLRTEIERLISLVCLPTITAWWEVRVVSVERRSVKSSRFILNLISGVRS